MAVPPVDLEPLVAGIRRRYAALHAVLDAQRAALAGHDPRVLSALVGRAGRLIRDLDHDVARLRRELHQAPPPSASLPPALLAELAQAASTIRAHLVEMTGRVARERDRLAFEISLTPSTRAAGGRGTSRSAHLNLVAG